MSTQLYDIVVIDESNDRRMRLKAATSSAGIFGDVTLCRDFRVGLDKLKEGRDRVIVFVASGVSETSITTFTKKAKETAKGRDSAYILILDSSSSSNAAIAGSVLEGVDGVLLEPFSVESLLETTKVASTIYLQRRREREESAISCIIQNVLKNVDDVSSLKARGLSPGEKMRELKDSKEIIHSISNGLKQFYYSQIIEQSQLAQVPAELKAFWNNQATQEEKALERLKAKLEKQGKDSSSLDDSTPAASAGQVRRIIRR